MSEIADWRVHLAVLPTTPSIYYSLLRRPPFVTSLPIHPRTPHRGTVLSLRQDRVWRLAEEPASARRIQVVAEGRSQGRRDCAKASQRGQTEPTTPRQRRTAGELHRAKRRVDDTRGGLLRADAKDMRG